MLARFRHRRIHFLSFYLAVFAILVQTIVPLAHANNINPNDQSGFFASLCTSNGIVLIDLDINANEGDSNQTTTVSVSNECPICNILEQDVFGIAATTTANTFETVNKLYVTTKQPVLDTFLSDTLPIRAPPCSLLA